MMPGVIPYNEVGAWIKLFDVATIPHIRSTMTANMNPLKVYVYLQYGIPIVSTDVANIGYNGPFIKIAKDHETFLGCLEDTLKAKPVDEKDVLMFIKNNDWSTRFKTHIDELLMPE